MKWFSKLVLGMALMVPSLGVAQNGFWTDRALGVQPLNGGITAMTPLAYGQLRVCTSADIGTTTTPCPHLASISDVNGNALSVIGGNFGQLTTDVVGRFSFQAAPGAYQIQVAATGSNTPTLNYPITISPISLAGNLILSSNNVWSGTNTFSAATIFNAGVTLNGAVTFGSTATLNADPVAGLQPATKQYVDTFRANRVSAILGADATTTSTSYLSSGFGVGPITPTRFTDIFVNFKINCFVDTANGDFVFKVMRSTTGIPAKNSALGGGDVVVGGEFVASSSFANVNSASVGGVFVDTGVSLSTGYYYYIAYSIFGATSGTVQANNTRTTMFAAEW